MNLIDLAPIIVALVAAFGAIAAQRSAAKASTMNTKISSSIEAEKGAYERARIFDTETIERQNKKIIELREENEKLKDELKTVKGRLAKLERAIPEWERLLHERIEDVDDY